MPSNYEIDPVRRIVVVTLSGDLTDEGLFKLYDDLTDFPEIKPDFAILIDLRQTSGRSVTSAAVGTLAQRPPLLSPEARRAVVVPSDFGSRVARMYNVLREGHGGEVAIFSDFAEARRWVETGEAEPHEG
jgi:hypothetical protein